ncbi:hypothetical protein F4X88_12770 [Candidatus Poribacteria bacterium]|nr:hypothetical protein [Candidatus Poribacteria bacterium]MYA57164.1 hypothetical protein [Candidatus Poribacteria bacterium]
MKTVAILSGEGGVAVETTPKPMVPPSRQGKKMISGHFDKDVHRQLKMLAIEKDTSIQDLLSEALNALFERNNKPPIA